MPPFSSIFQGTLPEHSENISCWLGPVEKWISELQLNATTSNILRAKYIMLMLYALITAILKLKDPLKCFACIKWKVYLFQKKFLPTQAIKVMGQAIKPSTIKSRFLLHMSKNK